jgi:DNA-binding response OmpR family regulator
VDRYPALLPTVELLLTQFGYRTITAHSVAEGLSCLLEEHVDVVIMDYTLCAHNHNDGECIVDRIRAVQPAVRIVLWSADDSVVKEGPPCADVILLKPVTPYELKAQLDSLLAQGAPDGGTAAE